MSDVAGQPTGQREIPIERGGPYVIAAALCESIIQESEEDGGLLTAVRILESITTWIQVDTGPYDNPEFYEHLPVATELNLLVALRGIPEGKHSFQLTVVLPDGSRVGQALEGEIESGGIANGANLKIKVNAPFVDSGIYWFELGFNRSRLLTRIPVEVFVERRVRVVSHDRNSGDDTSSAATS